MYPSARAMSAQPRKQYWIDSSCDEAAGGNFETYITEARHWAKRAYERLRSASDTDFARVFNVIFKTPKTDTVPCSKPSFWQLVNGIQPEDGWKPSAQHVLEVLHDFARNWTRTANREAAHVRIYANRGLRRWRRLADGRRYDPVNHVYLTGDWDDLVAGEAFTSWVLPRHPPANTRENPSRVTIDICPSAWAGGLRSLADLDPAVLLRPSTNHAPKAIVSASATTIADLSPTLLPRLLFHEFLHCRAYLLDDHPRDGETSGWEYCMRRKKGEAAGCAESVALLGLWAALADMRPAGRVRGGFSVDRRWDRIPGGWDDGEVFSDDEGDSSEDVEGRKWDRTYPGNTAVKGVLVWYADLTQ